MKKDYKNKLVKDIKIFLRKKMKKVAVWSWTMQKSPRKWKTKACWVYKKNIIDWEKWHIIIIKKSFNLENFSSLQDKV